jgi:hypothetical protein
VAILTASTGTLTQLTTVWDPAYQNLFSIAIEGSDLDGYELYHAKGINILGAKLQLKRNAVTKLFAMEKYNRSDTVTIQWRESSTFTVRRFHQDWLKKFYDESTDHYISYDSKAAATAALMRNMTVYLQGGYQLKLQGMTPQFVPDLQLTWDSPSNVEYSVTYNVTSWSWTDGSTT